MKRGKSEVVLFQLYRMSLLILLVTKAYDNVHVEGQTFASWQDGAALALE